MYWSKLLQLKQLIKSMKRYISEFLGTFILVFCSAGAPIVNELNNGIIGLVGMAMVSGLAVLAMIYSLGDISGAHLNPAVSIGFVLAKRMVLTEALYYIVAQFSAALLAAAVLILVFPLHHGLGGTYPHGTDLQSLALETILTFFLMFVILNVSRGDKEKGITAGIVISAVVTLEIIIGGPISGASMNPARSLGPAILSADLHGQWIYCLGPFLGSALAVFIHNYIKPDSTKSEPIKS